MKKMQQNHNKILVELINKTNSQNSKKFFKELDIEVKKIIDVKPNSFLPSPKIDSTLLFFSKKNK